MIRHTLRSRITFWFTATVIATLAGVLAVLHLQVQEGTMAQLTREMESTQKVFLSQQRARVEWLRVTAKLLGDLPTLGAAIDPSGADTATITDLVRGKRATVNCDFIIVTDDRGIVVGDTREPPALREDRSSDLAVRAALHGEIWPGALVDRDRIYQYASAPIRIGGDILGTVRVGLETNDTVPQRLKQETGSEVSFFSGGHLAATSLNLLQRAELLGRLGGRTGLARKAAGAAPFVVELGGMPYLSLASPLPARQNPGDVTYVIQQSLSEAMQPYRHTQQSLLGIGVLGLVCAAAVSYLVARGIADPVLRIVDAAEALGRGDWSQRVDASAADEVGVLAGTFNTMAAKLRSWDADLRGAVAERTAELNATVARLDAAFEQMRRFNADASHELRTPVTIVRGEAEVALRSTRPPEEYERVLRSILEETEWMGHIIDQLLLLARADSGELTLERSRVPLHELLIELQPPATVLARRHEVELEFGVDTPLLVEGDALRLHQLFLNLLDNATKYTPAGGSVRLTADHEDGCAVVRVTDTGIGIDPRHLPHLFERFFRVDKARSREMGGSGLGLAICKWIVDAHGGKILVNSRPGEGSVFTVALPLAPADTPRQAGMAMSQVGKG